MITVCGDRKATIEELRRIKPVSPRLAGRRWKAIQHGELVDTIRDEIVTRGWVVGREEFAVTQDGAEMVGAFLLDRVTGVPDVPDGMSLALGFINSNARRRALRITVGASVFCCENGVCTGDIILRRAHDHTVDLPGEVDDAVTRYTGAAAGVTGVVRGLREYELSQAEASDILMRAGHSGLVGWAAVGRVDAEYRNPRFAEHGKNNSWALLNAFTYTTRNNLTPSRQMDAYDAFRRMLPTVGDPNLN
jgi:hypothetical protein